MSGTTLSEWYLRESGGDEHGFRERLGLGQRIGQAFFNSLTREDQRKLINTRWDPFHVEGSLASMHATHAAIDFLCS